MAKSTRPARRVRRGLGSEISEEGEQHERAVLQSVHGNGQRLAEPERAGDEQGSPAGQERPAYVGARGTIHGCAECADEARLNPTLSPDRETVARDSRGRGRQLVVRRTRLRVPLACARESCRARRVTWPFPGQLGEPASSAPLVLARRPLAIAVHRLEKNGALVLFAFFHDLGSQDHAGTRAAGRVLFAMLVALGAYAVQFKLFREATACCGRSPVCSLLVPSSTGCCPAHATNGGARHEATHRSPRRPARRRARGAHGCWRSALLLAKADTKPVHQPRRSCWSATTTRRPHHGQRLQGDLKEFRHRGAGADRPREGADSRERPPRLIGTSTPYSAPRLVEYFDDNPCFAEVCRHAAGAPGMTVHARRRGGQNGRAASASPRGALHQSASKHPHPVRPREQRASDLAADNGYRLPAGASSILGSYLKQGG